MMEITQPEIHEKVWGEEQWIANREYCGKILVLKKGFRCSIHYHKIKDETFYILEGKMLIELDGERAIMNPGDAVLIKPGQKHRFTAMEDTRFIEFSTHHDESDSYRDTKSSRIEDFGKFLEELKQEGLEI